MSQKEWENLKIQMALLRRKMERIDATNKNPQKS
jgi:hypothetical protein